MDRKLSRQFNKIYNLNIEKIYRFVYIKVSSQEIAEDLTSEVFIRFWRVFEKRGTNKIENPKAFLYKTARNLLSDYYRAKPRQRPISVEEIGEIGDPSQQLEQREIISSDTERVQKAINKLKDEYQDVLLWYYLDELPVEDISNVLGKSENAVRVTIHRALKELRSVMTDDNNE